MRRIVVIGGGFSGASAALQLVRRSRAALDVIVIELRERVGGGLAYGTDEPEHRLNGQPQMHGYDPTEPGLFARWCDDVGAFTADPAARVANGTAFLRRSTFRAFLEDAISRHAVLPTGSTIRHVRDSAVDVKPGKGAWSVAIAGGQTLDCELVVIACGHTRARLPAALDEALSRHSRVIVDPLDMPRLPAVPQGDRVLVVGSSLTAYDAVSTLLAAGHRGTIEVVSRRGLRPRPQRPPPAPGEAPLPPMLERIADEPEAFVRAAGPHPTVRALLRSLRGRIAALERAGGTWDGPFDHLRDMAAQVWPLLSVVEKRRFFRQLRPWYDVHRFRVPPQNSALVHAAERRGQVRFRAAAIQLQASPDRDSPVRMALRERGDDRVRVEEYDRVINCTGVDAAPVLEVPLYAALLARGLITADPSGVGLAVDALCRSLGPDGLPATGLRIVGPPTLGARGDPLGSAFIAIQVHHMVVDVLRTLCDGA